MPARAPCAMRPRPRPSRRILVNGDVQAETRSFRLLISPNPDLVVVKGGTAIRRDRIGPGERVDPAAVGVGGVGPDRFGYHDAPPHALEQPRVYPHLPAPIAEHDLGAIGDANRDRI